MVLKSYPYSKNTSNYGSQIAMEMETYRKGCKDKIQFIKRKTGREKGSEIRFEHIETSQIDPHQRTDYQC
jgi:hypothetical protein